MTVEKAKPKQLLRPITTETNSAMNQSQFLAITCNSLEAREKSRVRGAIGFGFDSHWLKNWRDSFKPITKRSNRNHVITFDSHLKTALLISPISYMLAGKDTLTKVSSDSERKCKNRQKRKKDWGDKKQLTVSSFNVNYVNEIVREKPWKISVTSNRMY